MNFEQQLRRFAFTKLEQDMTDFGDAANYRAHAGRILQLKLDKLHREGLLEKVHVMLIGQGEADRVQSIIDEIWLQLDFFTYLPNAALQHVRAKQKPSPQTFQPSPATLTF